MSINPFDYWDSDPNGYLRHVMAGAFLLLAAKAIFKDKLIVTGIILSVAIAKEVADHSSGKMVEMLDVLFTIAPVLAYEICLKIEKYKIN